MDLFKLIKEIDFQQENELSAIHPELTKEKCASQMHLVEPNGKLYGGFWAFRRLAWNLPMLYPLLLVFYFPCMGVVGPRIYRWVANNRYLFHSNAVCKDNACFLRKKE
jgi:predicted DCC family thiol-disulfide oxidoreductase YuxK